MKEYHLFVNGLCCETVYLKGFNSEYRFNVQELTPEVRQRAGYKHVTIKEESVGCTDRYYQVELAHLDKWDAVYDAIAEIERDVKLAQQRQRVLDLLQAPVPF